MAEPILDRFERLRDADPDAVAVEILHPQGMDGFSVEGVTRASWLDGAARLASALRARGIERGCRVLLCLPTGRAFLDAFLGCLWCGAVPVPLPSLEGFARPHPFLARIRGVLAGAEPSLVIADQRTAAALRKTGAIPDAELVVTPDALAGEPAPRASLVSSDPAFLQYTSGSTGEPRGVVVTLGNVAANVTSLGAALALTEQDRQVTWLPLYHDMGLIGGLLTTALHGVRTSLLSPVDFLLRPALWLRAVSARRATLTVAPNFAYSLLAIKVPDDDLEGLDLSCLRVAVNGAEPVSAATAELFASRFGAYGFRKEAYLPVYGLAEATLAVTAPPLGRGIVADIVDRALLAADQRASPSRTGARFVSVGKAIPDHEVAIVDANGAALPDRRVGEIVVRGPSVSPGYFGEAPRGRPNEVATGDLGYVAGGELYVVDRIKDLILIAGRSYSPVDVERAVETVKGIRTGRCVAFSVPRPGFGTEGMVVVAEVARPSAAHVEPEVTAAVLKKIGVAPIDVMLVPPRTLARTSSGKIMRRDTRERYMAGSLKRASALLLWWMQGLRVIQGR